MKAPTRARGAPAKEGEAIPKPMFITMPPRAAAQALETLNAIWMPAPPTFRRLGKFHDGELHRSPMAKSMPGQEDRYDTILPMPE